MNTILDHSQTDAGLIIDDKTQIGLVRRQYADLGVFDISSVAQGYFAVKKAQTQQKTWCYENFTEHGSDATGVVTNLATGDSNECIIWPINHYLALNRHPYVIEKAQQALAQYGTGCGTSAMSGGHNALHKQLEDRLAKMLGKEASILYTTGYSANVGAISGLAKGKDNLIVVDREVHASIIDGCKLAGCKFIPFRHNSVEDLRKKLKSYAHRYKNVFVAIESVYSMTGEVAPLEEILALKKEFSFFLFVDEAHAFGLYGTKKGGLCDKLQCSPEVDFIMTTLSKATGAIGGVVAASNEMKTLMQVEANAYLFQAALPPADTAAVDAALDVIEREPELIQSVWAKTRYMREKLREAGFETGTGESPIIPVYVRDSGLLMAIGLEMFEKGVFTTSVQYPVVKHTEVRFRFILNESHSYENIDRTVDILTDISRKCGLIGGQ